MLPDNPKASLPSGFLASSHSYGNFAPTTPRIAPFSAATVSTPRNSSKTDQATPSRKKSRQYELEGFPPMHDPIPEDTSLEEICRRYPNHLIGEGLNPFFGIMKKRQIFDLMPVEAQNQGNCSSNKSGFLEKRLFVQKTKLKGEGRLVAVELANRIRESERDRVKWQNLGAEDKESESQDVEMQDIQEHNGLQPRQLNDSARKQSKRIILKMYPARFKKLLEDIHEKNGHSQLPGRDKAIGERFQGVLPESSRSEGGNQENRDVYEKDLIMTGAPEDFTTSLFSMATPTGMENSAYVQTVNTGDHDALTSFMAERSQDASQFLEPQRRSQSAFDFAQSYVSGAHRSQSFSPLQPLSNCQRLIDHHVRAAEYFRGEIKSEVIIQVNTLRNLVLVDPRFPDKTISNISATAVKLWCNNVKLFKLSYPQVRGEDTREPPCAPDEPPRALEWYAEEMTRVIGIGWEKSHAQQSGINSRDGQPIPLDRLSRDQVSLRQHTKLHSSLQEMLVYLKQWTAEWNRMKIDFDKYQSQPNEDMEKELSPTQGHQGFEITEGVQENFLQRQFAQLQEHREMLTTLPGPAINPTPTQTTGVELWLHRLQTASMSPSRSEQVQSRMYAQSPLSDQRHGGVGEQMAPVTSRPPNPIQAQAQQPQSPNHYSHSNMWSPEITHRSPQPTLSKLSSAEVHPIKPSRHPGLLPNSEDPYMPSMFLESWSQEDNPLTRPAPLDNATFPGGRASSHQKQTHKTRTSRDRVHRPTLAPEYSLSAEFTAPPFEYVDPRDIFNHLD